MRFVLVHGACHGAWCWDRLVPELNQLGHEAVAVDLPGHGTRVGETATLSGYRDAVVERLVGDDILVGHSMGAAVVSVAADARPDLVAHVTLLSGPLPVEGQGLSYQSTSTLTGGSEAEDASESVAEDNTKFTEDGSAFYWDRDGAYTTFYHDCDERLVDWAAERLIPQPLAPVVEPISIPRFWAADLQRSYVRCLRDRAWPSRVGLLQAKRMGVEPLVIDSSHSPFFSRPAELAALLVRAVDTKPVGPLVPDENVLATGENIPPAAITWLRQARARLGPEPLRALFALLKGPAAMPAGTAGVRWRGLLPVAVDGTIMMVADTAANLAVYSRQKGGRTGGSGYPFLRLAALVSCATRSVIDAAFGPASAGEIAYASCLLGGLRAGMLLLADRGFGYGIVASQVAGAGAGFLLRVIAGRSGPGLPVMSRCPDGSWLFVLGGVQVRVIDTQVTITTSAGSTAARTRLVTTDLDPAAYPAGELVTLCR